jgi:hypothetical protein
VTSAWGERRGLRRGRRPGGLCVPRGAGAGPPLSGGRGGGWNRDGVGGYSGARERSAVRTCECVYSSPGFKRALASKSSSAVSSAPAWDITRASLRSESPEPPHCACNSAKARPALPQGTLPVRAISATMFAAWVARSADFLPSVSFSAPGARAPAVAASTAAPPAASPCDCMHLARR